MKYLFFKAGRKRQDEEANNFTICFERNADIKFSIQEFPILDFATTLNFSSFHPMKIENISLKDGILCGSISTTSNVIFPIALVNDWEERNTIFYKNQAVKNTLYFMAAVLYLLCISSFVGLIYHIVRTKLPKIGLIFLIIYSGLRATYFVLFATEDINTIQQNNAAGFFILAELPYYLFIR